MSSQTTWAREGTQVFLLGIGLVVLLKLARKITDYYSSSLRHLKGPSNVSFATGNVLQLTAPHTHVVREWREQYGTTFRIWGPLMVPRLVVSDYAALNHILTRTMDYYKPDEARLTLARTLGKGILVAEGEQHRKQKRIMNPAFGPAHIRDLTEIFLEKANNLCDYWNGQISTHDVGRGMPVNIREGLNKLALDVIGLAGFGYAFESLNPNVPPSELDRAFRDAASIPAKLSVFNLIPGLRLWKDKRAVKKDAAQAVMRRIGQEIITERKASILAAQGKGISGQVGKEDVKGRDLLTLLIKANMAADIPDNQRMTDEEVIAQVPTFLVAGHETTSTAVTWALHALSQKPTVQQKLRDELLSVPTSTPSMEELAALPYLDKVVRETLRLHAPVTLGRRVAVREDVIPLSGSPAPVTDARGNVLHELRVPKGCVIAIPILALHTDKAIWGADALDFNPDRWDNPPEAIATMPGVWGHLLTFLGGPHACIGYRFSLVEMKAIVFTLIRTFEFEPAVSTKEVMVEGPFIQRPSLHPETGKRGQLPLLIRPFKG